MNSLLTHNIFPRKKTWMYFQLHPPDTWYEQPLDDKGSQNSSIPVIVSLGLEDATRACVARVLDAAEPSAVAVAKALLDLVDCVCLVDSTNTVVTNVGECGLLTNVFLTMDCAEAWLQAKCMGTLESCEHGLTLKFSRAFGFPSRGKARGRVNLFVSFAGASAMSADFTIKTKEPKVKRRPFLVEESV